MLILLSCPDESTEFITLLANASVTTSRKSWGSGLYGLLPKRHFPCERHIGGDVGNVVLMAQDEVEPR